MKEGSWQDCIKNNTSYQITSDLAKAKSLVETAKARLKFLNSSQLKEENANFIFEGKYSSLIELIHALVLKKGYKITNHLCLGFYLRDVLNKKELFRSFDDCRYKRNSLIYYGRAMDFEVAKQSLKQIDKLIEEIKTILK